MVGIKHILTTGRTIIEQKELATQFIGTCGGICEGNFCSGDVEHTLVGFC